MLGKGGGADCEGACLAGGGGSGGGGGIVDGGGPELIIDCWTDDASGNLRRKSSNV